jgi:hypothetical protein
MSDEEIAAVLLAQTPDVERRKAELLEGLAGELELDAREERDELFATLQDLPSERWRGGG